MNTAKSAQKKERKLLKEVIEALEMGSCDHVKEMICSQLHCLGHCECASELALKMRRTFDVRKTVKT